jgi:hypothetical protein
MADYEAIRKDLYERFHDAFEKLYISELKDQIADKDEIITANDHVIVEQQAEIESLRFQLNGVIKMRNDAENEIQQLRAALRMIAEYHRGGHLDTDEKLERDLMIGIARAALKDK